MQNASKNENVKNIEKYLKLNAFQTIIKRGKLKEVNLNGKEEKKKKEKEISK